MISASGVQEIYAEALRQGVLHPDQAQQQAIAYLDSCYRRVTAARHGGGWLKNLMARLRNVPVDGLAGVYLYGPVGRGKSMLMQFFIDAVARWNGREPRHTVRVERHHFHAFMLQLHRDLFALKNDAGTADDPVQHLADALAARLDVLCFDELHVTDVTDAMLLMPYFTQLLVRGVTVIATSNFAPVDLYKNGLQRERFLPFIDLLQTRLDVVTVAGPQDYRLLKWQDQAAQQDHWLTPLNGVTESDFAALFAELAGYDTVTTDMAIDVPGQQRQVTIYKTAAALAWLHMDALLAGATGAADFLALTQRFRIMLLDRVTPFSAGENDRARRFMLLIDTLYEAGTQIYVRADVQPEILYPANGRLAFEFARTISRLQEMRFPKR